jgi:hypothetical protein
MLSKAVPMNRRDMLHGSIRSAARALPTMIETITELAGLLKNEEAHKEQARPSCFPSGRKKSAVENASINCEEEGKK